MEFVNILVITPPMGPHKWRLVHKQIMTMYLNTVAVTQNMSS